ncbi:oogenesis-related [Poeciliopsis prolifica]|uniref:oogenesis-related n=1 Tax=Poeciliopsis prolifica TaxID=188132 RepID=UPI0024137E84|nr:oogenesis-related [Poeciliopsis prolifica]
MSLSPSLQTRQVQASSRSTMSCETSGDAVTEPENSEGKVVRRDCLFRSVLRNLLWPFSVVLRAFRGIVWAPQQKSLSCPVTPSPARHSLTGYKRLSRFTRLLLRVLPCWAQAALGYPVSRSIGRLLPPEVSVSPTKPCGKGSKRKLDELDDNEKEPFWMAELSGKLPDEDSNDPDYETSTEETDSEEFASKNDTESDLEISEKGVFIEDVNTGVAVSRPSEGS